MAFIAGYGDLFLNDYKKIQTQINDNLSQFHNNKNIVFFGLILGYPEIAQYRLESQTKDVNIWKNLCKENQIKYRICCDFTHSTNNCLINEKYLITKLTKLVNYAFDNLIDLVVILISGHGETKPDSDDYYFLLYGESKEIILKSNLTILLNDFLIKLKNKIQLSRMKILFLFDTCFSQNPLNIQFELVNTTAPICRRSFDIHFRSSPLTELNIVSIGASKSLTRVKFEEGEFVSEFTKKIFKLNCSNIVDSVVKIKSIHPECSVFLSKIV